MCVCVGAMIQWKQRLYAFLLRRVLGPLLDASANQQLHDSIEFSLQEGKFVLRDVSLNADHLSERLATNGSVVLIRKATAHLANSPHDFHYSLYNYYDHSHFYKHLKQFLQENTLKNLQPHLMLLEGLHK